MQFSATLSIVFPRNHGEWRLIIFSYSCSFYLSFASSDTQDKHVHSSSLIPDLSFVASDIQGRRAPPAESELSNEGEGRVCELAAIVRAASSCSNRASSSCSNRASSSCSNRASHHELGLRASKGTSCPSAPGVGGGGRGRCAEAPLGSCLPVAFYGLCITPFVEFVYLFLTFFLYFEMACRASIRV